MGGILIGFFSKEKLFSNKVLVFVLAVSVILFIFYPVSGNLSNLVSGFPRFVFSCICFIICFALYKLEFKLPSKLHFVVFGLGTISYSIYLLHPIVSNQIVKVMILMESHFYSDFNPQLFFPVVLVGCFVMSYLSYRFIEKPAIHLGNKLIS